MIFNIVERAVVRKEKYEKFQFPLRSTIKVNFIANFVQCILVSIEGRVM